MLTVFQAELNEVRTSLLEALSNPAEIITLVNRLNFGQCTYLLSVYRLESLRVSSDPSKFYSIFDYLEDKAIEKDKAGKEELFYYYCLPIHCIMINKKLLVLLFNKIDKDFLFLCAFYMSLLSHILYSCRRCRVEKGLLFI